MRFIYKEQGVFAYPVGLAKQGVDHNITKKRSYDHAEKG